MRRGRAPAHKAAQVAKWQTWSLLAQHGYRVQTASGTGRRQDEDMDSLAVDGLGTVEVRGNTHRTPHLVLELVERSTGSRVDGGDPSPDDGLFWSHADWWAYCFPQDGILLLIKVAELQRWIQHHHSAYASTPRPSARSDSTRDRPTMTIAVPLRDLQAGGVTIWLVLLSDTCIEGEGPSWRPREAQDGVARSGLPHTWERSTRPNVTSPQQRQ
jgi:hypothetical protein